ncbi:unnamed protein product [Symbiodinium sp. CCMP2592]|nr:unnamed protein product [Symbiodinium sp. CCMP2592]
MAEPTVEKQQNNLVAILKQNDEDEKTNIPQTRLDKANAAAVKHFLEIKKPTVSKLWWQRFSKAKLSADKEAFDDLVKESIFLPADAKQDAENYIPTIPCQKALEDLFVVGYDSNTTVLRERLNARKLWDAVHSNPARTANAELLQHFFSQVLARLDSGRGRRSTQLMESLLRWRSLSKKLRKHEECAHGLLEALETKLSHASQQPPDERASAISPQEKPVRRAVRKKSSAAHVEQSLAGQAAASSASGARSGNPFAGTEEDRFVSYDVTYKYKLADVRTRRYASFHSAQNLGKAWQTIALDQTVDLDIENCSFTLLLQILDKLKPNHECWSAVRETLSLCSSERNKVIEEKLKLPLSEGKHLLQKVFNGGTPPEELAKNLFIEDLQRASLFCRWVAATMLKNTAWRDLLQMKDRPDMSVLTYFWNIAEDLAVESWIRKVEPLQSKHMSLHFDGIRVDRDIAQPDVETFCRSCSDTIFKDTGLAVRIRMKQHYTCHALLQQLENRKPVECPECLRAAGNCILAALHHLGFPEQASTMALMTEGPEHMFFQRRRQRTYAQVAEKANIKVFPRLPTTALESGQKILLHMATEGNPHCVALEVCSGNEVRVTDLTVSYTFSVVDLARMLSEATDRKYMIFFHLNQKPEDLDRDAQDSEYDLLMETLAGGDSDDEFVQDLALPIVEEKEQDEDMLEDDESVTRVGDRLLGFLRDEVAAFLNKKPAQVADEVRKNGKAWCPFCPLRCWDKTRHGRVTAHVREYHSARKQFVASGTKQLKVIIALHDDDQCRRQPAGNYLRRSATLLSQSLDDTISTQHVLLDKKIRLVLTQDGPQYWSLQAVQRGELRRVYALHARLLAIFPGATSSLLPRHANHWWPMIEDIFLSDRVRSFERKLETELVQHQEFEVISMDATLRCCLPVMGQAHPRASREVKSQAVFHGDSALTRVVTCRGRTNAVLMLAATTTDETDILVKAMAEKLPTAGLQQVRCMSVDNPSAKLWKGLRCICPNLQILCLDPVHLAMTCEYASSRKRTAMSRTLRAILQKLSVHSSHCTENTWGTFFRGENCKPLTHAEERARLQIEDRSMPLRKAAAILDNLNASVPFFERSEWSLSLAALAAVYRQDMDRVVPGPNRKVYQLLHSAAAAARTEWYFNNLRARHMIATSRLSLLPVGTTSNESLHHEINNFFRETQKIHKTTLSLKLKILQLSKQMTHNAALYHETTRQMAEAEVLARTSSREMWSSEQWQAWCDELQDDARIKKASRQDWAATSKDDSYRQRPYSLARMSPGFRKRKAFGAHSAWDCLPCCKSGRSKWTETLSAANFTAALPSDWFGRQLLAITPELFDEVLSLRDNTETLLHHNIGLAIARLQGLEKPAERDLNSIDPHERLTGTVDDWKSSDHGGKLLLGPLEWDVAAVTRSMSKDDWRSSDHGGKLLLGPLEWDGAAVTRSMSKDDWRSSDHGGKLLLGPLEWAMDVAVQTVGKASGQAVVISTVLVSGHQIHERFQFKCAQQVADGSLLPSRKGFPWVPAPLTPTVPVFALTAGRSVPARSLIEPTEDGEVQDGDGCNNDEELQERVKDGDGWFNDEELQEPVKDDDGWFNDDEPQEPVKAAFLRP